MALETVTIFRADTGEAVKTIGDLKESIKYLKKELDTAEVGTKEYADTLVALQTQQSALKNAMHDTSYETEEQTDAFAATARAAKGLGTSYNALVRQMADLDQQFRATEDAVKRAELGKQINEINDQLKQMDADRGKFGRNVGNYVSHWEGLSKTLQSLPGPLKSVTGGLKNTSDALGLVGKQPVLGLVALLAPMIGKIVSALKENETALDAVKKMMQALKPMMDFFSGILETIAGWLSEAVDWVLELAKNSGVSFNKIVGAAAGVGNALKEFLLVPIRNVIDGAKALGEVFQQVFKGQFKEAAQTAKQAVKDIGDNFKQGFSFRANYLAGAEAGETFAAGLKSPKSKKATNEAGKALAEEVHKGAIQGWKEILQRMEAGDKRRDQEASDLAALALGIDADTIDYVTGILDEFEKAEDERLEREAARQEARKQLLFAYADTVSSVLSSVADLYENDEAAGEKNAAKVKALRTASAVIDTISGAIAAYMSGVKSMMGSPIPGAGIALGIAQAATVLAAGMAQVKKINAVKVGDSGGSSSAIVSAPAFETSVPQVRTVTGASEEDRLNRMASSQRVYILASDLQAERESSRVRIAETAW